MNAKPENLKVAKQVSRREILFSIARRPESEVVFAGASTGDVLRADLGEEKPQPVSYEASAYVLGARGLRSFLLLHLLLIGRCDYFLLLLLFCGRHFYFLSQRY